MKKQRILIISHGHPDISKGGAEIAAFNLFNEYKNRGIDTLFLARSEDTAHGGSIFSSRNASDQLLFHTAMHDWFNFRCVDARHITHDFAQLLESYKPTTVHFHHYAHMGLEMVCQVRHTCPEARILFTLHEYMAMCMNNGQMVKKGTNKLCYRAHPADCAKCLPDKSPGDFFLRERYIKSIFSLVDIFISPSQFLADRYIEWGIPKDKLIVIENGQPKAESTAERKPAAEQNDLIRFAFFGQINPFKGVDVMLEAFNSLPKRIIKRVHLDIHGANLDYQEENFKQRVLSLIDKLGNTVTLHGPYEPHEMPALLMQTDWVIVPSIWWENSPMVIQEAFNHGRPILCSDIGGMKEKVKDGVTGVHFRVGNPASLAQKITAISEESTCINKYTKNISPAFDVQSCANAHLGLE